MQRGDLGVPTFVNLLRLYVVAVCAGLLVFAGIAICLARMADLRTIYAIAAILTACLFLLMERRIRRRKFEVALTGSASGESRHWSRTKDLMLVMLALWFFFGFGVHFWVNELNTIVILGFPLGYYMAAQGSLIAFVALVFVFASMQNRIDREEGVAEDD